MNGILAVMVVLKRAAFAVGAAAILVAIVWALVLEGWEAASWVAAVVGALAIAGGLLAQAMNAAREKSTWAGDEIELRNVNVSQALDTRLTPVPPASPAPLRYQFDKWWMAVGAVSMIGSGFFLWQYAGWDVVYAAIVALAIGLLGWMTAAGVAGLTTPRRKSMQSDGES